MDNIAIRDKEAETFLETSSQNVYQNITLEHLPRLLSLMDRNPYSKTYGSFSRNYWQYKTLTDFPSATDEQAVLALSSLYLLDTPLNTYYQSSKILELIEAGINFWTTLQSKDGSFSEWYPNEHSHVATAFTSYAISESILMLKEKIKKETYENAIQSLKKSGLWLSKNIDTLVLNHTAGAIAALYNIYLITGEKLYLNGCNKNLGILLNLQDKEGWFPEYGNADPGYLGVTLDYLAKYWDKSKDNLVEKSLERALDFLIYFYQESTMTTGGEFGYRNTKYILPHGLLLLRGKFDTAKFLELNLRRSLEQNKAINSGSIDDKYFLFFHYPNFAQASLLETPASDQFDPRPNNFLKIFSSSRLVSCKEDNFHMIANLKKAGIMKLTIKNNGEESVLSDTGYFAVSKGSKKILTSQTISKIIEQSNNEELPFTAHIKTNFAEFTPVKPLSKMKFVLFRMFNYLLGKYPLIMKMFNNYIKKNLISQTINNDILSLEREITVDKKKIVIEDTIKSNINNLKLEKLSIEPSISLMHVPSSNFFHFADVCSDENFNPRNLAEIFNEKGLLNLKRIIDLTQSKSDIRLVITS